MDLIQLSIKRPKFITMATTFLIVVGFLALRKLAVDLYPNVSYPVLVVRASLPGTSPEEMEQLVTKRMEDALSTLAGIDTLRSVSREGQSIVIMEFNSAVDVRFQEIQVRGKIANLRAQLPPEMKEPEIFRQDPDDTPIIEIALTGDRSQAEMTKIADDVIARRLRQIPAVGQVDLSGERKPEIKIDLKPAQLDQWKINPKDVVAAIRAMNRNDPAGKISGKDRVWLVRSLSQAKTLPELARIAVARTAKGQPVFLGDIADISYGFAEVTRVSRFGDQGGLRPAVLLSVLKQSGENTVAVSDRIREELAKIEKTLPPDVRTVMTRDNADLVRQNVADVYESLVIGAILTIAVVLIFLRSLRSTLTTGLSLPSSVITTFAVMFAAGFTVNVMTLLALSLAIGLLVDDAIVVRENIFRHLHDPDPRQAAEKGAKEVQLAVVATTFTIVAVFLPVGFMGGVSGQFFKQFALTVVFAVLVSLFDAVTMAPMLSAYFANIADPSKEWAPFGRAGRAIDEALLAFEHLFDRCARAYGRLLHWVLPRPWVPSVIALLAILGGVAGFLGVKKSFLPTQFGTVFSASLQGPLAVPIERIDEVVQLAEARLRNVSGLDNWTVSGGFGYTGNASVNLTIRVKEGAATNQTALGDIRTKVRSALAGLPGYSVRVSEPADPLAGSSGRFQPLAVVVSGDDTRKLRDLGNEVRRVMGEVSGIVDIAQIQDEGLPEFQIRTDPLLAGTFGISAQNVSEALATFIQGDATNNMQIGDDQVPIRVQLKDGQHTSLSGLLAQSYFLKNSNLARDSGVALATVVHAEPGAGAALINRENRQRIIRVGANLAPGAALGDLVRDLDKRIQEIPLPQGYSLRIAGQNEQMDELFGNVLTAIGIGSIFVYMILVSLFESFSQPLTVLTAIPLAATGAVFALIGFGLPLDLYGGVGLILLAGIVAKNSILLVDFALQKMREGGVSARAAMLEAAPLRLRPIIMTTVAMIAGMVPVAAGLGSGGAARQSLGVATIGGVLSSTVLTLVIVPSLFIAVEHIKTFLRSK
jgi:HAE1 family hydrophobic/amphiphilic exporter-1